MRMGYGIPIITRYVHICRVDVYKFPQKINLKEKSIMKKFFSILLISAMLLTLVPMTVFADTTPTGTAISTVEQLKAMSGATSDS